MLLTRRPVCVWMCPVLHRGAGLSLSLWELPSADGGGRPLHQPGVLWPPADFPLHRAELPKLYPLLWWAWHTICWYQMSCSLILFSNMLSLLCLHSPVLVVVNHYMAFQFFAQEYYPFSEVMLSLSEAISMKKIVCHSNASLIIFHSASRCWRTSPSACGWSPSASSCPCQRGRTCFRPPCNKEVRFMSLWLYVGCWFELWV